MKTKLRITRKKTHQRQKRHIEIRFQNYKNPILCCTETLQFLYWNWTVFTDRCIGSHALEEIPTH